MAPHPSARTYDTLLQGAFDVPSDRARGVLALAGLLSPSPDSPAAARLAALLAEGGRLPDGDPFDDTLLDSDDLDERAVGLLCSGLEHQAAALLAGREGAQRVVSLLLSAVSGHEEGSPGTAVLLDLALRDSGSLLAAALSGLEVLATQGRTPSEAFLRFFSATTHTRAARTFAALAPVTALEAGLTSAQEEVFYTLALDGAEFHDAAEMSLGLA